MKSIFFIFLFVMMLNGVIAVGFSPSSLIFNLEPSQEECKTIIINSESQTISISDLWAKNVDVEWKVSNFETLASEHGISIDYDSELSDGENSVEVCLLGSSVGEYHGVMLFREEQQGNSIVQMGIWLKVVIAEVEEEIVPSPPVINDNGGSSSGGGSSGGNGVVTLSVPNETEEIAEEVEEIVGEDVDVGESAPVTGAVVGESGGNWGMIGIVFVLIAILGFVIYNHKRGKRSLEDLSNE